MNNKTNQTLFHLRLALQVPNPFMHMNKYHLVLLFLGAVASIIVRTSSIDWSVSLNPLYNYFLAVLMLLSIGYILYLEVVIISRVINSILYYKDIKSSISRLKSRQVFTFYYLIVSLSILLSVFVLYRLISAPIFYGIIKQVLLMTLIISVYIVMNKNYNWTGFNFNIKPFSWKGLFLLSFILLGIFLILPNVLGQYLLKWETLLNDINKKSIISYSHPDSSTSETGDTAHESISNIGSYTEPANRGGFDVDTSATSNSRLNEGSAKSIANTEGTGVGHGIARASGNINSLTGQYSTRVSSNPSNILLARSDPGIAGGGGHTSQDWNSSNLKGILKNKNVSQNDIYTDNNSQPRPSTSEDIYKVINDSIKPSTVEKNNHEVSTISTISTLSAQDGHLNNEIPSPLPDSKSFIGNRSVWSSDSGDVNIKASKSSYLKTQFTKSKSMINLKLKNVFPSPYNNNTKLMSDIVDLEGKGLMKSLKPLDSKSAYLSGQIPLYSQALNYKYMFLNGHFYNTTSAHFVSQDHLGYKWTNGWDASMPTGTPKRTIESEFMAKILDKNFRYLNFVVNNYRYKEYYILFNNRLEYIMNNPSKFNFIAYSKGWDEYLLSKTETPLAQLSCSIISGGTVVESNILSYSPAEIRILYDLGNIKYYLLKNRNFIGYPIEDLKSNWVIRLLLLNEDVIRDTPSPINNSPLGRYCEAIGVDLQYFDNKFTEAWNLSKKTTR